MKNEKTKPSIPADRLLSTIDAAMRDNPLPDPAAVRYSPPCWTQIRWGRILPLKLSPDERGEIRAHLGELANIDALVTSVQYGKARQKIATEFAALVDNPTAEALAALDVSKIEAERVNRDKHSALKKAYHAAAVRFGSTVGIGIMRRAQDLAAAVVGEIAANETKAARTLGISFEESTTLLTAKQALAPLTQYATGGIATLDALKGILPDAELQAIAQAN